MSRKRLLTPFVKSLFKSRRDDPLPRRFLVATTLRYRRLVCPSRTWLH
jgi:hypothetical protein